MTFRERWLVVTCTFVGVLTGLLAAKGLWVGAVAEFGVLAVYVSGAADTNREES